MFLSFFYLKRYKKFTLILIFVITIANSLLAANETHRLLKKHTLIFIWSKLVRLAKNVFICIMGFSFASEVSSGCLVENCLSWILYDRHALGLGWTWESFPSKWTSTRKQVSLFQTEIVKFYFLGLNLPYLRDQFRNKHYKTNALFLYSQWTNCNRRV